MVTLADTSTDAYRAMTERCAVVDRSERGKLALTGAEESAVVRGALEAGVPPALVLEELQHEVERRLIRTRAFYDEF